MYSFAIGLLTAIVSTLDVKTTEMNEKILILTEIKNEFDLDDVLFKRVRKIIKYDSARYIVDR